MLVSFDVENWACYRDRQQLSMETNKGTPDEFAFDTGVSKHPRLNRASVIYGPNGSGKSRFVEALDFARKFVLFSAQKAQAGDSIEVEPFIYDAATRSTPSSFSLVFVENFVSYEYGFAANSTRVTSEQLSVRHPGGRRQNWFSREYHPDSATFSWKFGVGLRGPRSVWRSATRENALFVSTAAQLNSESLSPIIKWFRQLAIVGSNGISHDFTSKSLRDDPEFKTQVVRFLRQMDIHVSEIRVTEKEVDLAEIGPYLPAKVLEGIGGTGELKVLVPEFGLPVRGGDDFAFLDLDDQSDGTQRVYSFAGPWLDVVKRNSVVVVDELDRSLHPHLVQFLIRFINDSRNSSEHRAQLVATVHDTQLLESSLDRRQVWFTEKNLDQSAVLTPLSNFRPRKNESVLRGYLGGRYGAIPNTADFEAIG